MGSNTTDRLEAGGIGSEAEYRAVVEELANKIDINDRESIRSVGKFQQNELRAITAQSLKSSTLGEIDEIGETVAEVLAALKETKNGKSPAAQGGWVMKIIGKFVSKTEDAAENTMTVHQQLERFNEALVEQQQKLVESVSRSEDLRVQATNMFEGIKLSLDALLLAMKRSREELKDLSDSQETEEDDITRSRIEKDIKRRTSLLIAMEKREVDLRQLAIMLSQAIDNIDLKLESDDKLVLAIEDTRNNAIPMVEMYLSIMIEMANSSKTASMIGATKGFTNQAANSVSEQTKKLVQQAGDEANALMLTDETVENMQRNIEESFETLQIQFQEQRSNIQKANVFLKNAEKNLADTRLRIQAHTTEVMLESLPAPEGKPGTGATQGEPQGEDYSVGESQTSGGTPAEPGDDDGQEAGATMGEQSDSSSTLSPKNTPDDSQKNTESEPTTQDQTDEAVRAAS